MQSGWSSQALFFAGKVVPVCADEGQARPGGDERGIKHDKAVDGKAKDRKQGMAEL